LAQVEAERPESIKNIDFSLPRLRTK